MHAKFICKNCQIVRDRLEGRFVECLKKGSSAASNW